MSTRYVVLAYGEDEAPFRQAWMLLVSLRAWAPGGSEFVVLTDRPDRFTWTGASVRIEPLSPGQLSKWRRGETGWRHKLEAARAMMPAAGALAMLDSDIVATADLGSFTESLEARSLFMHKQEYVLSRSRRAGNRRLWNSLRGRRFGRWELNDSDAMWNAGVVALHHADAGLLDDALELHDAIASAGPPHLFLEQLATSVTFHRTGRLRPASGVFAHYWGNKVGYDREIRLRWDAAREKDSSLEECAGEYRRRPIDLPVEVRPGRLGKLARWWRRGSTKF